MASSTDRELISLVVPVYNEETVIHEFHARATRVLASLPYNYEIIYVNDGSKDRSLELITEIKNNDPQIALIDLSRNFGKEIALTAGLDHANGDAVIVIDADLQDPPELIVEFIEEWNKGFDMVSARRIKRSGESALKRLTAFLFYRVMSRVGDIQMPEDTGDFRLISRRALDALTKLREQHRFMKGLFTWVGFPQTTIDYERDVRAAGNTKWSYWKLWNFALEGITSFTTMPLKFASYLGFMTAIGAFAYGLYMIVSTLIFGNPVSGYPSLVVIILFLGGIQLLSIGIMGEYLGRIFNETKQRPLYFINKYIPSSAGFDNNNNTET